MTTRVGYSSTALRNIGTLEKLIQNNSLFDLENTVRSTVINLGIRKRWTDKPYRRSRAGKNIFCQIHSFMTNQAKYKQANGTGINCANIISIKTSGVKTTITDLKLHCVTINCQLVVKKSADLKLDIADNNLDMCALMETWIKEDDSITPLQLCPPGYKAISVSRTNKVGGGLALVFHDNLDVKHTTTYDFASMECSDFRINLQNCIVNLAIIYRPPDRSVLQFALDILDYMECNINITGSPGITGDLNIKMNNKEDASTNIMLDILNSLDLVNDVNFPTHRSQSTLDLVITTNSDNIVRNPSQG